MKTHMELKLRDHEGRAVLVRVEHNSQAINDFLALQYSVLGVGANYLGRDKFVAAERVESITGYKMAPMLTVLANMADALLDLSCNKVTGSGERVSA